MAQKWVSFEEVKSQVSIRDVLAHYALMQGTVEKPSKHGLELRLRCPFHDDTVPSLSITGRPLMRYCSINWAAYSIVASGLTVTTNDVIRSAAFIISLLVCWKNISR